MINQLSGIPILINDHLLPSHFLRSFWWLDEDYRLEFNSFLAELHRYKPEYYVETIPGMVKGTISGAKRIITDSLGAQLLREVAIQSTKGNNG